MQLTGPVVAVIIGAVRARTPVIETGFHAVDHGPGGNGLLRRRRRHTLSDSAVVLDRLELAEACL